MKEKPLGRSRGVVGNRADEFVLKAMRLAYRIEAWLLALLIATGDQKKKPAKAKNIGNESGCSHHTVREDL